MRVSTAIVLCLGIAAAARCDTIVLSNGKQISGIVESNGTGMVRIRTGEGLVSLPKTAVAKIIRSGANENVQVELTATARTGNLTAINRALQKGEAATTAALVDALTANASAIVSRSSTATVSDIETFAGWWRLNAQGSAELALLVADLYAARGEFEPASEIVLGIPQSTFLQSVELRGRVAATLMNCTDKLIESSREDLTTRSLALLTLLESDAPSSASAVLLKIRASRNLLEEHRYADAVRVFATDLPSHGVALVRRQLMDVLDATHKACDTTATAEATSAILQHFSDWFGTEELARLRTEAALSLARCARYQEAFAQADLLSAADADKGAVLQHRVELEKRLAESANAPLSQYKAAVWAREMGLSDEAQRLLTTLSTNPMLAENVQLQQQLLEMDRAKADLQKLTQLYEEAKYKEVLGGIADFRSRHSDPELLRRAMELEQLTKYAQWNGDKRVTGQGEAAYQNAERLFNQARYAEASQQALKIVADYPNSPQAHKADKLLDKIAAAQKRAPAR
jgi:hypothetical protein